MGIVIAFPKKKPVQLIPPFPETVVGFLYALSTFHRVTVEQRQHLFMEWHESGRERIWEQDIAQVLLTGERHGVVRKFPVAEREFVDTVASAVLTGREQRDWRTELMRSINIRKREMRAQEGLYDVLFEILRSTLDAGHNAGNAALRATTLAVELSAGRGEKSIYAASLLNAIEKRIRTAVE